MKRGLTAVGILLLCAGPACAPPDAGGNAGGGGGWAGGPGGGGGGTGAGGGGGGMQGYGGGVPFGGGSGGAGGGPDAGWSGNASGPSHSSTIAALGADAVLVNPLFDALVVSRAGALPVPIDYFPPGSIPSSVAVSADGQSVYVTLRGSGQLVRLANPVAAPHGATQQVSVGSEPVAVALSPNGHFAVVALAGEPAVVVVETATGTVHRVAVPGVTRAVAITNDGDLDDTDEFAYVTLFFGEPTAEGTDTGRIGHVAKVSLSNFALAKLIDLNPISDTGIGPTLPDGGTGPHVGCSPNQLSSILLNGSRGYVANVCVSPEPPLQAFTTAFAALSVIDLTQDTEWIGIGGSSTLASMVELFAPGGTLLANPVDLAGQGNELVVLAQAANELALVDVSPNQPMRLMPPPPPGMAALELMDSTQLMCGYNGCFPVGSDGGTGTGTGGGSGGGGGPGGDGGAPGNCGLCDGCCVGSVCISALQQSNNNCGLGGVVCAACGANESCGGGVCAPQDEARTGVPIGLLITPTRTVVNDLTALGTLEAGSLPGAGLFVRNSYATPGFSGAPDRDTLLGVRFFSTANGRWSSRNALACATCHPDGLSDGVTWIFGTGPRQTLPLDGTFAKGDPSDHRVQNWTGVADEVYDVEGLVRSTMKGLGAITTVQGGAEAPLSLTSGVSIAGGAVTRNDGLNGSSRALSDQVSAVKDWTQLERFVQQVRTNRAPSDLDPMAVSRGRTLFATAGCASCHAGPKWTASHVPYTPSPQKNGSAVGDNGLPTVATGLRTEPLGFSLPGLNADTLKVAPESLPDPNGGPNLVIGPERVTCVLRMVGTFSTSERKADGTQAQGALGYNVPSLLGLATSAPYLHNGAAPTLESLFTLPFAAHYQAGTSNAFLPTGGANATEQQEISDLVAFLRSIDGTTPPFPASMATDICGQY